MNGQVSDGNLMGLVWALVCPGEKLDAVVVESRPLGLIMALMTCHMTLGKSFNLPEPQPALLNSEHRDSFTRVD